MKTLYIVLFSVFTVVGCSSVKTAEEQAKEEAQWKIVQQMVADKSFELEAEWAYPLSGSQINLFGTNTYFRFNNDSVVTYLPYYGVRRTGAAYINEGGIVLDGSYSDLLIKENTAKHEIAISFEIREKSENYTINLILYANKNADITVNSSQRDLIRYSGKIVKSTKPAE